jgi:hypothetical protein
MIDDCERDSSLANAPAAEHCRVAWGIARQLIHNSCDNFFPSE